MTVFRLVEKLTEKSFENLAHYGTVKPGSTQCKIWVLSLLGGETSLAVAVTRDWSNSLKKPVSANP